MNNLKQYKDIMAFHPGYYVADIIEDMGITQAEFATRMRTTAKTISKLVNGKINLSKDLAKKLSAMLGTSVDLWLNLQKAYDEKVIEIEQEQEIDDQIEIAKMIDYSYFEEVAHLPKTKNWKEKVRNLRQYFVVADLRIFCQQDFLVNFRQEINNSEIKNIVNSQAWLQTAINMAKSISTEPFNAKKLESYLPEIREMTLQAPEIFYYRLEEIFSDCGVSFVLLPNLKNSGINGAVKWINDNKVVLAINDRRVYADIFWFSLFHEIKHVLQQKTKTVFISSNIEEMQEKNIQLEEEANTFAQDFLIPPKEYKKFIQNKYISDKQIKEFAKSICIHPGIVVGRLQHDKIIAINRCSSLREKYKIIVD